MAASPAEILGVPKPDWASEDVGMLYDMATKFLETEIAPHYDEFEKAEIFDHESWKKAGENGLLCASMPEEYGGSGGTFAHESAIIEAISHVGVDGFGIALHNSIVAPYILHYGSEEQKKKWLPKMASGELIGAIAMTEPGAGSDLQGVKTRAEKDGNQYRINGSKTFITNGQLANLIIVVAKTDPAKGAKGTSLIVIETDEVEGFERGR
ncbi:MAG: acyl-CoA dehydrogenase family protein, partial [Rhizobiaceae bacterium]|nr:acyl-CoA dehydrogenase family protein [Rhizobiaceae bacterium]